MELCFDNAENIVERGKSTALPEFSPVPTMFSKGLSQRLENMRFVVQG